MTSRNATPARGVDAGVEASHVLVQGFPLPRDAFSGVGSPSQDTKKTVHPHETSKPSVEAAIEREDAVEGHLHTPRALGEERGNHKRQMRIEEDAPSLASPTNRTRVEAEEVGPPNRREVAEGADVGVVFVYGELPRIRHFCRCPLAATQPTLP